MFKGIKNIILIHLKMPWMRKGFWTVSWSTNNNKTKQSGISSSNWCSVLSKNKLQAVTEAVEYSPVFVLSLIGNLLHWRLVCLYCVRSSKHWKGVADCGDIFWFLLVLAETVWPCVVGNGSHWDKEAGIP